MTDWERGLSRANPVLPSHLYVHVPFCASKCDYCDFASVSGADQAIVRAVFAGIRTQLLGWQRCGLDGVLETVYFGGGTPSLHAREVTDLLGFIGDTFVVHPAAEITAEANPDSLDTQTASLLAAAGVTRVSVGVQSFADNDLRVLGRRHDGAAALRACDAVLDAAMDLSVDLMCAIPGQSRSSWADTLRRAAETGARHASVYPLSIEPSTPMQVAMENGLLAEPDPDTAADHMVLAAESLAFHGFERYEVANYATDAAHRSRHNTAYWTGRSYIGVGPGAHGMVDGRVAVAAGLAESADPDARVRYGNNGDIGEWLVGRGDTTEVLSAVEARGEDAMLGLRLAEGISCDLARAAGVTSVLESLCSNGLVETTGERWRVTERGWLLGNEVFGSVWAGE